MGESFCPLPDPDDAGGSREERIDHATSLRASVTIWA
jgi:hypothetical protein